MTTYHHRAPRSRPYAEVPRTTGFALGRIAGVQIQVDWSLLLIFALIVVNLGGGLFPRLHPDWTPSLSWTTALAAALLFFISVLAHELSHAVVAHRFGISVRRITLFMFGGMAHMEDEVPSPKAEFSMAIIGPVVSVLIGFFATWLGGSLAGDPFVQTMSDGSAQSLEAAFRGTGPLPTLLLWLGPLNIFLGLFNMVPGFPLDGGRVLRSLLWWITKDLSKATRWAAGAGQLVGMLMMALGLVNLFGGAFTQGLWLMLLGWFLHNAARRSYQDLVLRNALEEVPVVRVMRTQIDRVDPQLSLDGFVRDHVMAADQQGFPVEEEDTLVGMLSVDAVRKIPQSEWTHVTVGDVMTPTGKFPTLPPSAGAQRALSELTGKDVDLPVVEGQRLLGLVRRGDLLKWLTLHAQGLGTR